MPNLPNLQVVGSNLDPTQPGWYKQPKRPIAEILADREQANPQQVPGYPQAGRCEPYLLALVQRSETFRSRYWWALGLRDRQYPHYFRSPNPHRKNHHSCSRRKLHS